MKKKSINFRENRIFLYNRLGKRSFGIGVIVLGLLIVLLGVSYFFLKDSDIFIFKFMNMMISHFSYHIGGSSLLGVFYTTLIGGLFFVSIPLELLFIKFLKTGHYFLIIMLFYFIGLLISYSINYFIGLKLSKVSKKLISPKKFYKIKGLTNKYGALAVFFFNALPLPSQLLAVVLGVFRYNKTRFYIFFLLGQLVKYLIISIVFLFF
ncbi:VTT domain-containing protein [Candidatus Woesearchaeota archaeon]|nr:VTT domain-containing protein [Candidatus Woesearchaeota archaeon]